MSSTAAGRHVSLIHIFNLKPYGARPSPPSPSEGVPGLLHGYDPSRDTQSDPPPSGPCKSIGGGPASFVRLQHASIDASEQLVAFGTLHLAVATRSGVFEPLIVRSAGDGKVGSKGSR